MKKQVIAICGKSGSGKDTIMKEILKRYPNSFKPIVSYTTRPRRENEIEGIDYHLFLSKKWLIKLLIMKCLKFLNLMAGFMELLLIL